MFFVVLHSPLVQWFEHEDDEDDEDEDDPSGGAQLHGNTADGPWPATRVLK